MINRKSIIAYFTVPLSVVAVALSSSHIFAQNQFGALDDNVRGFGTVVSSASIVLVALAFLFFFFYLAKFILVEAGKDESKQKMIWSIVALIVLTSLWGIITFVRSVFGVDVGESNNVTVPTVDFADRN